MHSTIPELTELSQKLLTCYDLKAEAAGTPPWSKTDLVQGFVGDVGDLVKLTMAKSGKRQMDNVDTKLGHELADCLWSVLLLAKEYDVDLEKELRQMIEAKVSKHTT